MLIKSLVLGAALISTPLCFLDQQDPKLAPRERAPAAAPAKVDDAAKLRDLQKQLSAARKELDGAKRDLGDMRRQVNELLDIAEQGLQLNERRNHSQSCSPSISRSLLSHYQWLEKNRHEQRAQKTLAAVVERAGDDPRRLGEMARELMTEKATAGQFDRVALALAERIEERTGARQDRRRLDPRLLDTVALAHFLNGGIAEAIANQQAAIECGGNGDDYRRRLRTYEAALAAVAAAQQATPAPNAAVAANDDD